MRKYSLNKTSVAVFQQPVYEVEPRDSNDHPSEPDRPSEEPVFQPAFQETSEMVHVALCVEHLLITASAPLLPT